ncbi:hypothetical protein GUI12_02590 [Anaplasmataceae bacterium AB001_6]|nr:hypothetical protein GUI12_02590 [Anaplasmataceae bacterium AB001_6]
MKKNIDVNCSDSDSNLNSKKAFLINQKLLMTFVFIILSIFAFLFIDLSNRLVNIKNVISNIDNSLTINSHILSEISSANNRDSEHFKNVIENNITHVIEQVVRNLEMADPTSNKFFFSFLNIENMIFSILNDAAFQPELFINKELISNVLNIANLTDEEKEVFLNVLNQKKKIKTYQKLQVDSFDLLFNYISVSEKFFKNQYKKKYHDNNSIIDHYINNHIINFLDNNISINTQMPDIKSIENISHKIIQKNFINAFEDLKNLGEINDYLLSCVDGLHKEFLETSAFLELLFNIRDRYKFMILEINTGISDVDNVENFSDKN